MDIWEAVKETLCYDSPEGHGDDSEIADRLEIGLKDTLSFSWRALKESRLHFSSSHHHKYQIQLTACSASS